MGMGANGLSQSKTESDSKSAAISDRRSINLFSFDRLHARIARIISNAFAFFPTTLLAQSKERASAMQSGQDRAIKIIRSKADLFWNFLFYLSLLRLPHAFLFGGRTEFESHDRSHRWRLAALPHHSWCLVHADDDGGGPEHEGLRRYYEADKTLQSVHPTLFASLKPMVTDRLYDALIVVLQQRAVIAEETHALALKGQKAKHTKMQYLVMNEPLYRMLGKLLPRYGRYATTLHAKAYQKAMEHLSASH